MAFAVGEVIAMLLTGPTADRVPYTLSLCVANILLVAGGILYAVSVNATMVIFARLLLGCSSGCRVIIHAYIGKEGTQLDQWRVQNGKRPIKYIFYIAVLYIIAGGNTFGYGEFNYIPGFS